jgi:hypothetical protein
VVPREKSKYMESFKDWERAEILAGRCPDCGGTQFCEGPSGGMSTNWMCDNEVCGSRFNIAQVGPGAIMGKRISEPMPLAAKASAADAAHAAQVPVQKFYDVSVTRMVEDEYLGVEAADHDDALRKVLAGEIDGRVQKDKLDEKYVGAYVFFDGDPDAPGVDYTLDDKGGIISKEQDEPQLSKRVRFRTKVVRDYVEKSQTISAAGLREDPATLAAVEREIFGDNLAFAPIGERR